DGNYVVASSNFGAGLGAITWGNGSNNGARGTVTSAGNGANSLVGAAVGDQIGSGGVVALNSGHYVIVSPNWTAGQGAVTWEAGGVTVTGTLTANTGQTLTGSAGSTTDA